jgi:PilZ domain
MAFCPDVATLEAALHPLRRRQPRYTLRTLSYVKLDQANGGIVRDVTESGIAIQAVAALRPGQELALSFDLLSPRVRVDTCGRVIWADRNGQAGIQFDGLALRTQNAIRDWLFTQMLSIAALSSRDSMFALESQLMLSAAVRPAILVDPEEILPSPAVNWGFFQLSARSFSIFVDALVLTCAVLIFSISSIAIMGGIPPWPLAAALFLTSSTIFVAVYQLLFSDLVCGATPGRRLAMLASTSIEDEPDQRFR